MVLRPGSKICTTTVSSRRGEVHPAPSLRHQMGQEPSFRTATRPALRRRAGIRVSHPGPAVGWAVTIKAC
jgi:hypothetical protein